MTDLNTAYEPFLDNLNRILERNGFPDKRVSLPLEKMYEVAHEKGLNFNKALEQLAERGVAHEKTNDKIIFFSRDDMLKQAEAMLRNLPPEQLRQFEEMFRNMPEEEKAQMMEKAKGMGLVK